MVHRNACFIALHAGIASLTSSSVESYRATHTCRQQSSHANRQTFVRGTGCEFVGVPVATKFESNRRSLAKIPVDVCCATAVAASPVLSDISTESVRFVEGNVVGQKVFDGVAVPLVLQLDASASPSLEDIQQWAASNRASLESLAAKHGAILFRGLPTSSAEEFDRVISSFGYTNVGPDSYIVGSLIDGTSEPADVPQGLHHEAPQRLNCSPHEWRGDGPSHVFFAVEDPAEGGEITLALSSRVHDRLLTERPEFLNQAKTQQLLWQASLSREDWEKLVTDSDMMEFVEMSLDAGATRIEWGDDAEANIMWELPAVKEDPLTKRNIWLNNIGVECIRDINPTAPALMDDFYGMPGVLTYSDGAPISNPDAFAVNDITELESTSVALQSGDILFVDNIAAMHGRNPFSGKRKVYAALVRGELPEPTFFNRPKAEILSEMGLDESVLEEEVIDVSSFGSPGDDCKWGEAATQPVIEAS
eukprot:CAMPEP_0184643932 /NCGR_PEP_ID=MMETSP0308-20130426/740_1 /TAXON_ID=38269 /ORGANISM="Gloeochaete witrockiana, Strain SAG 46.84" /LENGTH=476 /DNA_ID=CAMNT_0027072201 /DNA_START=44 /DNA_END=1474 /DNA_ORIENTATION=+